LVPVRSNRVDLGARFVVSHHPIKADAAGERAFPVALAFLDVGTPETAGAVELKPAEEARQLKRLRRMQEERLTLELAAVKPELRFEETEHALSFFDRVDQPAFMTALQVVQMPPAGVPNMWAGDELAGDDI